MMRFQWMMISTGCLLIATMAGCDSQTATSPGSSSHEGEAHHDHGTTGPHGGPLIELGGGNYHAELVSDESSGAISVYLLDASAAKAVAIEAESVAINLTHDGQAEQFSLAADPEANDGEGLSSRFTSNDADLKDELKHHDAQAQLVVAIEGRQFRGKIEHDHDHDHDVHEHDEDHDHAGEKSP